MKPVMTIIILTFGLGCYYPECNKTDISQIIEYEGIAYKVKKPFTGTTVDSYENGNKKEERHYKNGKKNGKFTRWYTSGQITYEQNHIDGELNGSWIYWFENGQKMEEGHYLNGKKNDLWTTWGWNGSKRRAQEFKEDELNGPLTVWYENGQKLYEGTFKDGKRNGTWTVWNREGKVVVEELYNNGKRVDSEEK